MRYLLFDIELRKGEAPRPKGRGFPERNNGHFNKAPLDPALKGGAGVEQSGQGLPTFVSL
jgi:hypothetical protein